MYFYFQNVYVQKDPNVVIFYVKRLGQNQIFRQVVKAVKVYNYDYHQMSFINVYDLNRQSKSYSNFIRVY